MSRCDSIKKTLKPVLSSVCATQHVLTQNEALLIFGMNHLLGASYHQNWMALVIPCLSNAQNEAMQQNDQISKHHTVRCEFAP